MAVVETLVCGVAALHSAHFSSIEWCFAAHCVVSEVGFASLVVGLIGLACFFIVFNTDFFFYVEFFKSFVG